MIKNTWAGYCAPRRQRADLAHVSASGEVVRDLIRGGALRRTGRHCVFSLFSIVAVTYRGQVLCAEASASRVAPVFAMVCDRTGEARCAAPVSIVCPFTISISFPLLYR